MMRASLALALLGAVLLAGGIVLPELSGRATGADPDDAARRGRALFQAKGCAVCHMRSDVPGSGRIEAGPDLTHVAQTEAYLRRWLDDPRAVKPSTTMPRLGLAPDEIDALVAYLKAEQP
jgi:cytochrome c oxidase subunit 2